MANKIVPEVNRRQAENGVVAHVVETLIGKQSRKVALGVWLLIIATSLLKTALITSDLWMKCVYLVCGLVGFGTIMDEVLLQFGSLVAGFAAEKVKSVFSKKVEELKTETTVTTTETPPPPAAPQP